jgi:hypothetical protein
VSAATVRALAAEARRVALYTAEAQLAFVRLPGDTLGSTEGRAMHKALHMASGKAGELLLLLTTWADHASEVESRAQRTREQ